MKKLVIGIVVLFAAAIFAGSNKAPQFGFKVKPALQIVTTNSVSMTFETFNSDVATVGFSTNANMSSAKYLRTTAGKLRKVTITGLQPKTKYYYRVQSDGITTATKSFVTALTKGSRLPFRFIVYGDSRKGPWYENLISQWGTNADHLSVLNSMKTYAPDFAVHVGDYAFSGVDMEAVYNFFDVEKDFLDTTPLLPTYGNHEFKGSNDAAGTYFDSYLIPAPGSTFDYYSYTYGNVFILVINTGGIGAEADMVKPGSAQYTFINNSLDAAYKDSGIDHIFVSMHCPLYSVANFGDNAGLIATLEPLFVRYKVRAVFYGHEHDAQVLEKRGIYYFLSGGAGSPVFDSWIAKLIARGDLQYTSANLLKYEAVPNYIIVDVNNKTVNFQFRMVQGGGNSSSSVLYEMGL